MKQGLLRKGLLKVYCTPDNVFNPTWWYLDSDGLWWLQWDPCQDWVILSSLWQAPLWDSKSTPLYHCMHCMWELVSLLLLPHLLTGTHKHEHILTSLHWLPVHFRITCGSPLVVFPHLFCSVLCCSQVWTVPSLLWLLNCEMICRCTLGRPLQCLLLNLFIKSASWPSKFCTTLILLSLIEIFF